MLLVGLKKAFLAAHHGGLEDENEFFLCVCLVYAHGYGGVEQGRVYIHV